jgi:outer membrane receptor for ferrienterochelin and colicin
MLIRRLAALSPIVIAAAARADDATPFDIPIFDELDRIVVTATLNERPQKDVAGEVSVIEAVEINRRPMQDLDVHSHWQVHPRVELFGAIANLADRRYWQWGMVGGFAQSATIDRYSAPGPRDPGRFARDILEIRSST